MSPPSVQNPSPARKPSPDLQQAILALRAGRAPEAEGLAAKALARGEEVSLAAKILGQALLIQGRAEAAIAPLEQAARGDDDPELRILLGRALGGVGREADALASLGHAAAHRPVIPQAFLTFADYLWKLGRRDEAVAKLEEGLGLSRNDALLKIGLGYFHLRRNDHTKARGLFADVHAAAPAQYDALVGLAMASALGGDFGLAADLYRRGLESRPTDATTRLNLAKCLLEIGAREAGEAAIREAARGARQITPYVTALADTAHGRLILRPSQARRFLIGAKP
jgi:tetratricopeptide (TPR) repeat protein